MNISKTKIYSVLFMVCISIGLFISESLVSATEDITYPRVTSIEILSNQITPKLFVKFKITFNQPVTGVDITDFSTAGTVKSAEIREIQMLENNQKYLVLVSIPETYLGNLYLVIIDDDSIINTDNIPLGGIGQDNGNFISNHFKLQDINISPTLDTKNNQTNRSIGWFDPMYTSLAITKIQTPMISHYDPINYDLKLTKCDTILCQNPHITTVDRIGNVGYNNSIALTKNDVPVISYYDVSNQDLKLAICNNTVCSKPTIRRIDSLGDVGQYPSIALTSKNIPVISYYDGTNNKLKLAVCRDAICSSQTISVIDTGYFMTSLAITSTDIPVISYHGYSSLKIAVCNNLSCTRPVTSTLDNAGDVGYFNSLALTKTNIPIISHYNLTTGDLKLAICNNTLCTSSINQNIDTVNNVGYYSSIALTSDDIPVVAYHDMTYSSLKIARCNSQLCDIPAISTIANDYNIGQHASIKITSSDLAIISFFDSSNNYLMLHSDSQIINTGQPNSFQLAQPKNNSSLQPTTVMLSWNASLYATSYEYCIATSTAACTNWKSVGTKRIATVTGLAKNKTYFWQVRAKNASGTTVATGPTWKFTTAP